MGKRTSERDRSTVAKRKAKRREQGTEFRREEAKRSHARRKLLYPDRRRTELREFKKRHNEASRVHAKLHRRRWEVSDDLFLAQHKAGGGTARDAAIQLGRTWRAVTARLLVLGIGKP